MILHKGNRDQAPKPRRPFPWTDDDIKTAGRLLLDALHGDLQSLRQVTARIVETVKALDAADQVDAEIAESLDLELWPDNIIRALVALGDLPYTFTQPGDARGKD